MGKITIARLPSHLPENGSGKLEVSGGNIRLFKTSSPYELFWDSQSQMTEDGAKAFYAALKEKAQEFYIEGYGSPGVATIKLNIGNSNIKPSAVIRLVKITRWLVTHDPVFEAKAGASTADFCQQRECMTTNKATITYIPSSGTAIAVKLYKSTWWPSSFVMSAASSGNNHEFTLAAPPQGSEDFADIWLKGDASTATKLPGPGAYEIRIFDDQTLLVKIPLQIRPLIELKEPSIELGSDGKAKPFKFDPYGTGVDMKFDFHLGIAFQDDQQGYGLLIKYILNGPLKPPTTNFLVVSDAAGGDVGTHPLVVDESCLRQTSFWGNLLPGGGYKLKWEGFTSAINDEDASKIWKFPGEAKGADTNFASPAKIAREGTYKVTLEGTYLYDTTQKQTVRFKTEVNYDE
ncbi:MAG: hypothetical protein GX561_12360 [Lentisphaerae bacterium]|jgi:hypothetical protein|nr:hypothetical protein [Lentisphaerota bacterium]